MLTESEIKLIQKSGLRAGQFIWNAMNVIGGKWESPEANALFFISDKELKEIMEEYIKLYMKED